MSKVVATNVIPDEASDDLLTIGAASDAVAVNDSLNVNTLKDVGGNTIFVSDGSGTLTSKSSSFPGALQLLSTANPSGAASVDITSNIDSTYDVYCLKFIEINSDQTNASFMFNGASVADDSGNDQTKTTTIFYAQQNESGANNELAYYAARDLAQSSGDQYLAYNADGAADSSLCGELYLFGPSSPTYVKHFYATIIIMQYDVSSTYCSNYFVAGYFNTTNVIDKLTFNFDSGNIADGTIKLYGISKS